MQAARNDKLLSRGWSQAACRPGGGEAGSTAYGESVHRHRSIQPVPASARRAAMHCQHACACTRPHCAPCNPPGGARGRMAARAGSAGAGQTARAPAAQPSRAAAWLAWQPPPPGRAAAGATPGAGARDPARVRWGGRSAAPPAPRCPAAALSTLHRWWCAVEVGGVWLGRVGSWDELNKHLPRSLSSIS